MSCRHFNYKTWTKPDLKATRLHVAHSDAEVHASVCVCVNAYDLILCVIFV